jgi:hypothetical protein
MGWLSPREPVFVEPTPLLVARLKARGANRRRTAAGVLVGAVALLVIAALWLPGAVWDLGTPARYMAKISAASVATLVAMWWILRGPRRTERRIARTLRTRVARPATVSVREVVGSWHLAATAASYAAAVLIGAVAAATVDTAEQRWTAAVFLAAVAACALIAVAALGAVLRRPALAEDSGSLAADDLLRTDDARRALGGYPLIVLVAQLAAVEAPGNWWIIGGYAVAVLVLGRYAEVVEPTRPVALRADRMAVAR